MPNPNNSYRRSTKDIKSQREQVFEFDNVKDKDLKGKIFKKHKATKNIYLYHKLYFEKNKTKILAWRKEYYLKNKQKIIQRQKEYYLKNPEKYAHKKMQILKAKYDKYWADRMEVPLNERMQHLMFQGSGNKFIEKLRIKNLEYLYRKAPGLKDMVLSDDELMDYILKNEDI